ncbi:hypothetical protein BASA81_018534 [Batrachochytrium salamandrivorans]|nr:hypothetical protein BASA81_018534 [Batrachochytrium salamandrivorans]
MKQTGASPNASLWLPSQTPPPLLLLLLLQLTSPLRHSIADAVKKRPTHQQLVERQPEFRKAGAAAWLALKRETSVPAHSAPKVELSSGLRLIMQAVFHTLSLATFERPCRVPASVQAHLDATIVKSFKAWVPRSEAADKDKLAAISSLLQRPSLPSNAA